MAKGIITEAQIQRAVVQHLQQRAKPDVIWFHPANGGRRDIVSAVQFKRAGLVPGVADIICLREGKAYALELKKEGGRTSQVQIDWLAKWQAAGGTIGVARGLDEALRYLSMWSIL